MTTERILETCFGCGVDNPRGLQLSPSMRTVDGELVVDARIGPEFEGFKGVVHGGISTTMLDEAMSALCTRVLGLRAVTGEISVRFVRPVPTETDLVVRARGRREGRKVVCSGEISDTKGQVLVEGNGTWIVTGEADQ